MLVCSFSMDMRIVGVSSTSGSLIMSGGPSSDSSPEKKTSIVPCRIVNLPVFWNFSFRCEPEAADWFRSPSRPLTSVSASPPSPASPRTDSTVSLDRPRV